MTALDREAAERIRIQLLAQCTSVHVGRCWACECREDLTVLVAQTHRADEMRAALAARQCELDALFEEHTRTNNARIRAEAERDRMRAALNTPPVNDSASFRLIMALLFAAALALLIGGFVFASDSSGSLDGGLTIDDTEISVSEGGVAHLAIDLTPTGSGLIYWTWGSVTGTRPGIERDFVGVPLNSDGDGGYLQFTWQHPNTAPLTGSFGVLNASGQAVTTFTVPAASDPGFAGLTVSHCATIWTFSSPPVMIASTNAVDVELVP